MLVLMVISLYTSRVVIDALGLEDYGIMNAVGGLVAFIGLINAGMSNATVRFITFSLGTDTPEETRKVFNNSLGVHAVICLILIIIGETIGLWFFFDQMNIPEARLNAAFVVYQLALVSTVLAIMVLPFNSLIMAHERMSIYAYVAIVDVVLKLLICYLISISPIDKLVTYGILLLVAGIIYALINIIYCYRNFPESHVTFRCQRRGMKRMTGFAGWSMVGCASSIISGQGINLLLNIFGGPILNAARGIAIQVQGVLSGFVGNFQAAVTPQIIKNYAANELTEMHKLVCFSSKYSFYILLFITLPIICNINTILHWWLKSVPEYCGIFLSLIMINSLIGVLSNSLMKSADATGDIRRYHLIVGGVRLLVLPTAYVLLKVGFAPESVFVIQMFFEIISLYLRLYVLKDQIHLSIKTFAANVLVPISKVTILSVFFTWIGWYLCPFDAFLRVAFITLWSCPITLFIIWKFGMNAVERVKWKGKIKQYVSKIFNRRPLAEQNPDLT